MRVVSVLWLVLLTASCANSSDGPRCESLGEGPCIDSPECTLILASERPGDYACVTNRNACENGFVQRTGDAASCEKTTGCRFVPATCYCPPDVTCVCGGGPPAQCVPEGG